VSSGGRELTAVDDGGWVTGAVVVETVEVVDLGEVALVHPASIAARTVIAMPVPTADLMSLLTSRHLAALRPTS
jgi:hypothetical protein